MPETPDTIALRLAAIVASSDDAIASKDLNGIIQTWNPAAERMFGYTAAEVIGKPMTIIVPADRLDEEKLVLSRIRSGQSVDHFETIRRRKDGTLIEISLTVSPIKTASGTVIGASKIARDISTQRRLMRELEEANRLKDDFLATLSHELRTPLNAIVGYVQMLRTETIPPDRRERALEIIGRNANALGGLISDILDVSRVVAGKFRLNGRTFEVAAALDNAIDALRPALTGKEQKLRRKVDPEVGEMWGDPDRLQQVFWNLLSNAVKFTPIGGVITVELKRSGNAIECRVTDTGIGIKPDFLPCVFQPFRQAAVGTARESGGLGLGLALVRHIVELHGGEARVASAGVGTGSSFVIRLPLARPQTQAADPPEASSRTESARQA